MLRSWKLGRFFGIDVYLHWTFLLLVGWAVFAVRAEGPREMAFLAGLMAAVGGCVLLHEFGHALMARHFGIATRDITLYPIGGVARLQGMGREPLEELFIAMAGPAVNIVIVLVLAAVLAPFGLQAVLEATEDETTGLAVSFLVHLLLANLVLALFNLIPAFPMDGGRILRGLLAVPLGHMRATAIAARLGMVLALGLILLPVVIYLLTGTWLIMLSLVGLFVFFAGRQELRVARLRASSAAAAPPGPIEPAVPAWPGSVTVTPDLVPFPPPPTD